MSKQSPAPKAKRGRDVGCLVMAVAFLAVGLGFGGFFASHAWQDLRVFTVWKPTTCTILDKEIRSSSGPGSSRPSYRPAITFRYQVAGREFRCTGWDSWALSSIYGGGSARYYERVLDRFEVGRTYPCWYNPGDPSRAVLERRIRPLYLLAVMPLVFFMLGAVGLYSTLARPTRRLGITGKAEARERSRAGHTQAARASWDYPRLAVRLEPDTRPSTQSCMALLASVAMLFVGLIAGYSAWSEWQDGNASLFLMLFLMLFLLLFVVVFGGLGLVFLWIAAASSLASRVPETIVEIARRSVAPGEDVEVLILQPGPLRLRSLRIRLVGKVETPAKTGSPVITILSDTLVSEVGPTTIGREGPLEHRFTLRVPQDARPSEGGGGTRVSWRLEVWGVPLVWPRFMLDFPIMVEPTRPDRATHSTGEETGQG